MIFGGGAGFLPPAYLIRERAFGFVELRWSDPEEIKDGDRGSKPHGNSRHNLISIRPRNRFPWNGDTSVDVSPPFPPFCLSRRRPPQVYPVRRRRLASYHGKENRPLATFPASHSRGRDAGEACQCH